MVRTILTPNDTHIQLDIPKEYVGKKIEITYLALEELESKPKTKTMGEFWGILSDATAQDMHANVDKLRKEWDRDI